jgi:hypothetical protein
LTVIEKNLLPARPVYWITAGKRGSGKTTVIHMISMAALGITAASAAWSTQEEERRKALLAYLYAGLQMLVWDNLARGSVVSSPCIEKASTSEFYSDRLLGASEPRTVPAYTVQVFTGNNIWPKGDLVSRSLMARLGVDRPDPENRTFSRIDDPVAWTNRHRGKILKAAYTILLGNPRRRQQPAERDPAPTRFKEWWDIVGSAVEHAAACHAEAVAGFGEIDLDANPACPVAAVDFKTLFQDSESEDGEESSLVYLLRRFLLLWPNGTQAKNVAGHISREGEEEQELAAALVEASGKALRSINSTTVTWRLRAIKDAPANVDGEILVLRHQHDHEGDWFRIEKIG